MKGSLALYNETSNNNSNNNNIVIMILLPDLTACMKLSIGKPLLCTYLLASINFCAPLLLIKYPNDYNNKIMITLLIMTLPCVQLI